jgi:hypothetical protein
MGGLVDLFVAVLRAGCGPRVVNMHDIAWRIYAQTDASVNQGAPGTTGMLQGMKESYKEGDSDSILALSLAGDIARCRLKRRQGYRWAGLLSFEKRKTRTPTLS